MTGELIIGTLDFIGDILAGRQDASQLGGPIGIAQMSGQFASVDPMALVQFIAILSVSVGFLNLLPIPVLDGGHLLFYAYEAVAGRPLDERLQEFGFRVGLILVLTFLVFATWNDIGRLTRFFGS